jgi:putative intracellular protease/amidase
MQIALFYYDGFSGFETVLTGLLFRRYDFISVALENREYVSEERQRYCVDKVIREVDVDSIDLLVIPGGEPGPLVENRELKCFIEDLLRRDKKVAGICGGASLLAGFGLLKGKKCTGMGSGVTPRHCSYAYYAESTVLEDHVVVDGNIITAQGQAYVEFAVELVRQMGLYKNQAEYDEDLRWLKNIR